MKKTDIGVVAFMYLVCAYFYTQTIKKVKKKNYKSAIYEARYIKYM